MSFSRISSIYVGMSACISIDVFLQLYMYNYTDIDIDIDLDHQEDWCPLKRWLLGRKIFMDGLLGSEVRIHWRFGFF